MRNNNYRGFTTIELLTVIAIIIILVGIGIPAYNSWRNRGNIARARAVIQQLEMVLEMYKTENGAYPDWGMELNNPSDPKLKEFLTGYMKFNSEDMGSGNPPERDPNGNILLDPWGHYYVVFVDHDGDPSTPSYPNYWRNRNSCYIYSYGPDGIESHASYNHPDNADNIDNCKP